MNPASECKEFLSPFSYCWLVTIGKKFIRKRLFSQQQSFYLLLGSPQGELTQSDTKRDKGPSTTPDSTLCWQVIEISDYACRPCRYINQDYSIFTELKMVHSIQQVYELKDKCPFQDLGDSQSTSPHLWKKPPRPLLLFLSLSLSLQVRQHQDYDDDDTEKKPFPACFP